MSEEEVGAEAQVPPDEEVGTPDGGGPDSGDAPGDDPDGGEDVTEKPTKARDPVRVATLAVLGLCVLFFVGYVWADRVMPFTDQARVAGYAVPVVPQVSGYVTAVDVGLGEEVGPGDVVVQIDTTQYQIGLRSARATLDNTLQQLDVASAAVNSAAAAVAASRAQETIARRESERVTRISERNPDALSQADRDRAEAGLAGAEAQVAASESELVRARAALGEVGDANPAVRAAIAGLENAELNLARTQVYAPTRGAIGSLDIDLGHFAAAGKPLMTVVTTTDVWIQADMRENNLENLKVGDVVQILLDSHPGEVFEGTVRSVGLGVSGAKPTTRGALPQVSTTSGWLRQPQQFPVVIDVGPDVPREALRIGAQATVMVFTGVHPLLNPVGRLMMRFLTILSYAR